MLALCAAGCEVHTHSDYDSAYDGTLTLDWSLDDSFSSRACDDFDAYDLELVIYDDRGREFTHEEAPCDDFGIAIDLPDGVYSLDATLLDRAGHAVSTTLSLDDIDIYEGRETPISIDFPLDSQR